MKTSVFFLASMMMAVVVFSQNNYPVEYTNVEVTVPRYQDEIFKSVNDFLQNAVQYPVESKNWRLEGTEVVEFIVSLDGTIKDFKVINCVSSEIDDEVIRALQATNGKWKPGMANNEPVEMKYEISVAFVLISRESMIENAVEYQKKGIEYLYAKNNPDKALTYFEKAIVLLPYEECLLALRGLCHFKKGDLEKAYANWTRVKEICKDQTDEIENMEEEIRKSEGYQAMITFLEN